MLTQQVQYSGGQATEGQGGFYGSGGARVVSQDTGDGGRSQLLALAQDVEKILHTMDELDQLESLLRSESDAVSSKSIELKAAIKKLMTSAEVLDALNRLEVEGAPVWGLSSEEREMIIFAREKMNEV